jgi:UrcA family protein
MRYAKALSISAAFALSIFAPATPAAAKDKIVVTAPPSEVVVRRVSFADLNLATPAGEQSLNSRVGYAVNDLCDDITGGSNGSLTMNQYLRKCSASAWGQARPQMARAIQRAHDIAETGTSTITAAALTISLPPL